MKYNQYGPHIFYFDYELEREEENLEVEVAYTYEDGEIRLDAVKYGGREIETTYEEDDELVAHAYARLSEDLIDAEASYGDYLYDMRRDDQD